MNKIVLILIIITAVLNRHRREISRQKAESLLTSEYNDSG
jgi:hypothetical protein